MKKKILAMMLAVVTIVSTFGTGGITSYAAGEDSVAEYIEELNEDDSITMYESTSSESISEETDDIVSDIDMFLEDDIPDNNTEEDIGTEEECNESQVDILLENIEEVISEEKCEQPNDSESVAAEESEMLDEIINESCIHDPLVSYQENVIVTTCGKCGDLLSRLEITERNGVYYAVLYGPEENVLNEIEAAITDTEDETCIEFSDSVTGYQIKIAVENRIKGTCSQKGSFELVVYVNGCEVGRECIFTKVGKHKACSTRYENEIPSTCTSPGYRDVITECACGHEISRYIETIPLIGHTEGEVQIENVIVLTCHTSGSYDTVVYCTVCGEELTRETHYMPKRHRNTSERKENVKEASCEEDGFYDKVVFCSDCQDVISRERIVMSATGCINLETIIVNKVEAGHEKDGYYDEVTRCKDCGREITREHHILSGSKHEPGSIVYENEISKSCIRDGKHDEVIYCNICQQELSRTTNITAYATGHIPGMTIMENVIEPTIESEGSFESATYCSVCGCEISRVKIVTPKRIDQKAESEQKNGIKQNELAIVEKQEIEVSSENKEISAKSVMSDSLPKEENKVLDEKKIVDTDKSVMIDTSEKESVIEEITEKEVAVSVMKHEEKEEIEEIEIPEETSIEETKEHELANLDFSRNLMIIFAVSMGAILLSLIGMIIYRIHKKKRT